LTVPEVVSAFHRSFREKRISGSQLGELEKRFLGQIRDIEFLEITDRLALRAAQLINLVPLKTLDSLQVAAAVEAQCDLFVTADQNQGAGARKAGLRVEEV